MWTVYRTSPRASRWGFSGSWVTVRTAKEPFGASLATELQSPRRGTARNRMNILPRRGAWLAEALLQAAIGAHATEYNPVARQPTTQPEGASLDVIVKLRTESSVGTQKLSTGADRGIALA